MTTAALNRTNGGASMRRRRQKVLARDGGRCVLCGAQTELTIHHIRPRLIGGTNEQRNMATLCVSCHRSLHQLANGLAACVLWFYGSLIVTVARRQVRRITEVQ